MTVDTLTRIETLSANEALLQSRLGECVNAIRHLSRIFGFLDTTPAERGDIKEALAIASRSEDALRTIREGEKL